MMNRLHGLLFTVLIFALFGCNQASPPSQSLTLLEDESTADTTPSADTEEKLTVALVMKTLTNPFFIEMEKGAREAETEFGIELLVKTGAQETSIEQQIAIIEDLINKEVQAIVIAPADSQSLIPVLKKAQDAGIVIVNIDNQLDPEVSKTIGLVDVPFISVNNEQGGYLSAKYISDQITEPTEVAILEGIRSAQNATDRKNGALRAFAENKNINVVMVETANWKIDEAYDVTQRMFKTYPHVGAIFAANDMMALGTIRYLEETKQDKVLVAAYDALQEAKNAIIDGSLQATIDQQAALQGYTGVQYAVKAVNGETMPPLTLVDVLLVTADNAK